MIKTEEMQVFVQIVISGTITAAAQHLQIAKSAVSRRLSEMEEQLGVELFHRSTRKLNLTESGNVLYERCVSILDELHEMESLLTDSNKEISGQIKVAAPLSFGLMHLSSAIIEFKKMHPAITFDIDFNDREIDIIQEGFDVAIRIADLKDSSLIARKLVSLSTVVCASPEYISKYGEAKTPSELVNHECISYSYLSKPEQWDFFDNKDKLIKVIVNKSMRINNGEFMREAASAGLGVLRQPTFIAFKDIDNGKLVPILENYTSKPVNAYAVYPPTRHLSQRVRQFIDFLVVRYEGKPCWEQCLSC